MTSSRSTKRALLTSALAILMCVAMLIGSTFAWFTDTASTAVNKIQAGNLDIEVQYRTTADGEWKTLDNATDLFGATDTRFEPGHTRVVELKIKNAGNLALKYKIGMNVVSETAGINKDGNPYKLSNYLKVATTGIQQYNPADQISSLMERLIFQKGDFGMWTARDFANFELEYASNGNVHELKPGAAQILGMKVYMPTTVGNEANAISPDKAASISFGLSVVATQYTVERDSYDNKYDQNAQYPEVSYAQVSTQDELDAALTKPTDANGEPTTKVAIDLKKAGTYNLTDGIAKSKDVTFIGTKNTVIDVCQSLDGESGANSGMNYQDGAVLAFKGVTILGQASGNYGGIVRATTTFEDCTIKGKLTLYGDATFINCTFENPDDYSIWTWGAKNVTFNDCTFMTGGKAINLYGGADHPEAPTTILTVNNCVFNDSNDGAKGKAAIEIGNDYGSTYILTVKKAQVNGFAINTEGTNTGSKLWANKKSMDAAHLTVIIDGVKVQ